MKTTRLYELLLITFIVCGKAQGAVSLVADSHVEIGSGNTFATQVAGGLIPGMIAVGTDNRMINSGTGAFGTLNEVGANGGLAVGADNDVGVWYYEYTLGSAAIGQFNRVVSSLSLAVGASNNLNTDFDLGGGECSLVVGAWNFNLGAASLIVGRGNSLNSFSDLWGHAYYVPECASLFGRGLISHLSDCMVVGRNNRYTLPHLLPPSKAPLFVVGNGSSASQRSNAFEVLENGDIIISKPQGDISMGIYGD